MSTASWQDVMLALDTKLEELDGDTPIAWHNNKYVPTLKTMYLRPSLLSGHGDEIMMNGVQHNPGIYQIDVYAPLNQGIADVLSKMDSIYQHFKDEPTLTTASCTIYIRAISRRIFTKDDAWLIGTVEIDYDCYV